MGLAFEVRGLPPTVSPEAQRAIKEAAAGAFSRKVPTGIGGPVNPRDVLCAFKTETDLAQQGFRWAVAIRVPLYPVSQDGKCAELAHEIVHSVIRAWELPPWCTGLRCTVKGLGRHQGFYEVYAADIEQLLK